MSDTVPSLSIVFMTVTCAISFGLPIFLLLYFRIRKRADILPFFIGCAVMLLFALVIERACHQIILASPAGDVIRGNLCLYACYGGFMAGLFEETGRFLAFKTVLRGRQNKDANALMYGAGHGGFEAMVLVGIVMINDLVISIMINSGNTAALTNGLSGDALAQVETAVKQLIGNPSSEFLLSGFERIFAITVHIALSVLVWFAAKYRKCLYLYPLAILIHLLVDGVTVLCQGIGASLLVIEVVVGILSVATALIARLVWKRNTAGSLEDNANTL